MNFPNKHKHVHCTQNTVLQGLSPTPNQELNVVPTSRNTGGSCPHVYSSYPLPASHNPGRPHGAGLGTRQEVGAETHCTDWPMCAFPWANSQLAERSPEAWGQGNENTLQLSPVRALPGEAPLRAGITISPTEGPNLPENLTHILETRAANQGKRPYTGAMLAP